MIFGVMGVINLTHGSLPTVGAYIASTVAMATGSLWLAAPLVVVGGIVIVIGAFLKRGLCHLSAGSAGGVFAGGRCNVPGGGPYHGRLGHTGRSRRCGRMPKHHRGDATVSARAGSVRVP